MVKRVRIIKIVDVDVEAVYGDTVDSLCAKAAWPVDDAGVITECVVLPDDYPVDEGTPAPEPAPEGGA